MSTKRSTATSSKPPSAAGKRPEAEPFETSWPDTHKVHPFLSKARRRMTRRWAKEGLDPKREVQEFLDLAFSICPHSPYDAARFVYEVGRPPTHVVEQVWSRVQWPRSSGAAAAKTNLLAAVVWDLRQWAGQMREEPLVIAVQVRRDSISCLGVRPEPIARYLSQQLSAHEP